ncbi:hypothetical protein PBY51_008363 [Eleginops maclovinus]|uniref:Uncharacterized protein n=1 Tax=Eleginops maclovinus TaxID=56733 RepID=A0AAN8AIW1_ELEMC|nr:hypothetical protein PBY51_008363 [Eleginops maclovinus]
MWYQSGADFVPVAPLASPPPSVICVNICRPKVPLSPDVRALCLASPFRKPAVSPHQTGGQAGESAGFTGTLDDGIRPQATHVWLA